MKRILCITMFCYIASIGQPIVAGESLNYSIARGGKLYDKWFKVNSSETPTTANPAYPSDGKYKGNKASDWRCKECHGWDYMGQDGAYKEGKHFTGISGILQSGKSGRQQLLSLLQDKNHGYSPDMLNTNDVADLSNFLQHGLLEMDRYIDRATKKVSGNLDNGEALFQTICAECHGLDGKEEDQSPPLGKLSNKNPWETLHKILNGQPGEDMVALRALDLQISIDILAYLQTLPKE